MYMLCQNCFSLNVIFIKVLKNKKLLVNLVRSEQFGMIYMYP